MKYPENIELVKNLKGCTGIKYVDDNEIEQVIVLELPGYNYCVIVEHIFRAHNALGVPYKYIGIHKDGRAVDIHDWWQTQRSKNQSYELIDTSRFKVDEYHPDLFLYLVSEKYL